MNPINEASALEIAAAHVRAGPGEFWVPAFRKPRPVLDHNGRRAWCIWFDMQGTEGVVVDGAGAVVIDAETGEVRPYEAGLRYL